MVIRNDVPVLAHDKPGSFALIGLFTFIPWTSEKEIKTIHRVGGISRSTAFLDIDNHDRRSDLFVNGRVSVVQLMGNILRRIRGTAPRQKLG